MPLSNTPLKLWLKLQCQMTRHCTHAVLARTTSDGTQQIVAKWPEAEPITHDMTQAVKQILCRQRMLLAPVNEQQLLLAQSILLDGEHWGAVIFCLDSRDKKVTQDVLALLQRGLVWLQFLLRQPADAITHSDDKQLLQLTTTLLKEKSLSEAAITLVNLLATQFQFPRVSLGFVTANHVVLNAISFSANFDSRTQAMQVISDAMNEAMEQHVDIHFKAPAITVAGLPDVPEPTGVITRCHEQLLLSQQLASVHSFLLRSDNRILGVITIEEGLNATLPAAQQNFIRQLLMVAAIIFSLKQTAAASVWQRGKQLVLLSVQRWFGEEQLLGKIIAAAVIVLTCVLFFPATYWIGSDASLQSINKHLVVSPLDGYLGTISARPGDPVQKGALLAQLNDEELRLERRKIASQLQQYQQEYDNALAMSNRVAAAIANAQIDQATAQARLLEQQLQRTQLRAPTDGIVVSDDISQSLGAPVKQGEILFEIAAAEGYLVQLFVDERDIAAIQAGQTGQVKLTSVPGEVFEFAVKTITPLSEVRDGRNYFRVEAALVKESAILRPGMTGSGKIAAGKHALGWIWFHDLWYWFRLSVWW